jgi:iron-sulfur cluster assembly accessory protein
MTAFRLSKKADYALLALQYLARDNALGILGVADRDARRHRRQASRDATDDSQGGIGRGSCGADTMIQITDRAATHIRKMLATRNRGESGLRVGVKAGGCSGFEYTFGWEAAPRFGDSVFEAADDAKVFVDAKSLRLLDGSVVDYDTSLLSKGFVITNPHAASTCGCGTSFSVERPTVNQTVVSGEKS